MPLSPEFYRSTLDRLSSIRPITAKRMFGGAGVYLDGAFFCVLDDDKIFFKVDSKTATEYEAAGMGPWMMGGQPNDKYRELPPHVLDHDDLLGEWMDASARVASVGGKKK